MYIYKVSFRASLIEGSFFIILFVEIVKFTSSHQQAFSGNKSSALKKKHLVAILFYKSLIEKITAEKQNRKKIKLASFLML